MEQDEAGTRPAIVTWLPKPFWGGKNYHIPVGHKRVRGVRIQLSQAGWHGTFP